MHSLKTSLKLLTTSIKTYQIFINASPLLDNLIKVGAFIITIITIISACILSMKFPSILILILSHLKLYFPKNCPLKIYEVFTILVTWKVILNRLSHLHINWSVHQLFSLLNYLKRYPHNIFFSLNINEVFPNSLLCYLKWYPHNNWRSL